MRGGDKYKPPAETKNTGKIKRRTIDRQKDEEIYHREARAFYEAERREKRHICIFCGEFVESFEGLHHWKGRIGKWLLDKFWWSVVHNDCHMNWHNKPIIWLIRQTWWDGFLARAKEKHSDIYRIIEKRIEKQ
jgi:hypothetical protein